jgi:hypothetical protein
VRTLNRHDKRALAAQVRQGNRRGVIVIEHRDVGDKTFLDLVLDNVRQPSATREYPRLKTAEERLAAAAEVERDWRESHR